MAAADGTRDAVADGGNIVFDSSGEDVPRDILRDDMPELPDLGARDVAPSPDVMLIAGSCPGGGTGYECIAYPAVGVTEAACVATCYDNKGQPSRVLVCYDGQVSCTCANYPNPVGVPCSYAVQEGSCADCTGALAAGCCN